MRNKKLKITALIAAAIVLVSLFSFTVTATEGETAYYVCFSSQNYAVRNSGKMTQVGEEYLLTDVEIGANEKFIVTDNKGTKYYAKNGEEMSTGETGSYSYTVRFSPTKIYSEESEGVKKTDCHISFGFYVPDSITLNVAGSDTEMVYNSYFTDYDLYYISSVYLNAGNTVMHGEETHNVNNSGYYRILYTPTFTEEGNDYRFNSDGEYGSGEKYTYNIYIEDAPRYFVTFVDNTARVPSDTVINGENAYILSRDEKNVTLDEYFGATVFINECDYILKYRIYEETLSGEFVLIDDDGDKDTTFSKITVAEVGNYDISFTDGGDVFSVAAERIEYDHDGWYILGNMNGWGFTEEGEVDLFDDYKLTLIEEDDEDYDEDYDQYRITLTVTDSHLSEKDFEFFITDGEDIFENLTAHIKITKAGEYELIFSPDHDYGRGRNYRYSLTDPEGEKTELTISTVEEFLLFAAKCNESADYSKDLIVYLAADIDFGGKEITPITVFNGVFRGGYHKLSGFTFSDELANKSVFVRLTRDSSVERLTVDLDISDKDSDYVGFIGKNYGSVSNVTVTGNIEGKSYVGAVVAYNGRGAETTGAEESAFVNGEISFCVSHATVKGQSNVGGIAGFNNGEISKCKSFGKISGKSYSSNTTPINLGGIAGYSAGRIVECENRAELSSDFNTLNVGGIAGQMTGDLYFSYNYGNISGTKYVGGVVGYYGTVTDDENDRNSFFGNMSYEELMNYLGDDTEDGEQIDGRVHAIYYAVNEGKITAKSHVGGILGYSEVELPLSLSVNSGDILAEGGGYAGGIIGYGEALTVTSSINSGSVNGSGSTAKYSGGIGGYVDSVVGSMSTGEISAEDYAGGIAGYASGALRGNYSSSIVITPNSAHNAGDIAGASGSFNESMGDFEGNVTDNYYVGSVGGIGGIEYGASYDNAARSLKYTELISFGVLSEHLSARFADYDWIGGESDYSYPQPRFMTEVAECDYYGDEDEFKALFESAKEIFTSGAEKISRASFVVSFLEYNPDGGDLYDDDGKLLKDAFEVVSTVRVYLDEQSELTAPEFIFAEKLGSLYITDTDKGRYIASYNLPKEKLTAGIAIYADYREVMTTLEDESCGILVEGIFEKGSKVTLAETALGYNLVFSLDGAEFIPEGNVTVKFKTSDSPEGFTAYVRRAGGTVEELETGVSGSYLCFTVNTQDSFTVSPIKTSSLPTYAVALIALGAGILLTAAVFTVILIVKRKKQG